MGINHFPKSLLLFSLLLLLCFSPGFGGRQLIETVDVDDSSIQLKEESRQMIQVMDYEEPGPNTNPKAGFVLSPPPPHP